MVSIFSSRAIFWILGLFLIFAFSPAARAEGDGTLVVERVVATLDGEPFTMGDLKSFLNRQGQGKYDAVLNTSSEELQQVVKDLISEAMLEKEAKGIGVVVADQDIKRYIDEIKRNNNVDDPGLTKLLENQGMTLDDYSKAIRADILRTKVFSQLIRSKINVVDEEIVRYLEEHPDFKRKEGKVHAEQVLLRFEEGDRDKLRHEIASLRSDLESEDDWQEVGGERYLDFGFVRIEDLRPELQGPLARLEPGAVSEVIESDIGFHLVRIQPQESKSEEISSELKDKIRQEIFQAKMKDKLDKFLTEELPKKYFVEIKI